MPLLSLLEIAPSSPPLSARAERRHPQETGVLPASRARPQPPSADWAKLLKACRAETEGVREADSHDSDRDPARAPYQVLRSLQARVRSERRQQLMKSARLPSAGCERQPARTAARLLSNCRSHIRLARAHIAPVPSRLSVQLLFAGSVMPSHSLSTASTPFLAARRQSLSPVRFGARVPDSRLHSGTRLARPQGYRRA